MLRPYRRIVGEDLSMVVVRLNPGHAKRRPSSPQRSDHDSTVTETTQTGNTLLSRY